MRGEPVFSLTVADDGGPKWDVLIQASDRLSPNEVLSILYQCVQEVLDATTSRN
jgi:hypothetical protein